VSSPRGAAGVVFSHYFVDSSREVDQQVFLQVARCASKVGMVGLCELCGAINEGKEMRADAPKGFHDAWDD